MDVFDRIRRACRTVAERARFVSIRADALASYAEKLPIDSLADLQMDADHHYVEDHESTLAYFVTLDAINFGSGYFPHLRKRPGCSGYFTISSRLADQFRNHRSFSAEELAAITPAACTRIFCQEGQGAVADELMTLFAQSWNDLGRDLLDRFEGSFDRLISAAEGSAARLVELLTEQPLFRDVSTYQGLEIPFFKRAQIMASDMALAFGSEGYGRFDDLDRLTIFADNLVPHVLRIDGILEYDTDLLHRIDRGELLPAGAEEETEIRACAVHAVALLAALLRDAGIPTTERNLDVLLWTRGQDPAVKAHPRHRTRTAFY